MYPIKIYYEPEIMAYPTGQALMEKYNTVPATPIDSHNNIPELRARENTDFVEMKKYLIIGIRKSHKYVANNKISDFLVPYTSSGCSAMCLYCYLVCNYNKCSYLRVYANSRQMLDLLIKRSTTKYPGHVFEIGSNSDLILENVITGILPETIEEFGKKGDGKITFPTKFSMVDDMLHLNHQGKTNIRMSVNPQELIKEVEIGTSPLLERIEALNKLHESGYETGLLIAPVILVEHWQKLYTELLDILRDRLSLSLQKQLKIEIIFMTYSYVHRAINDQAFPGRMKLYSQEMMTGRGRGKYCYRQEYRLHGEEILRQEILKRFHKDAVVYVV